ncbi:hypothetical protein [Northern red-backed vole stool-associated alphasatellite 129]|nr:hypothetical protein [Northern red-backed vole stool-associated alphasatellite 129]
MLYREWGHSPPKSLSNYVTPCSSREQSPPTLSCDDFYRNGMYTSIHTFIRSGFAPPCRAWGPPTRI